MTSTTYYAVQPFESVRGKKSKVLQPIVAGSDKDAIRKAERMAKERGGAIAFSRAGDDDIGDFDEPIVLGRFGEVPREFE